MKTINCLRCRQCRLEPDTDFGQVLPMVFCAKSGERRPACLTSCPIADPNTRYQGSGFRAVLLGGDKSRNATPAELAYLAVYWKSAPMATLVSLTGRLDLTLLNMARRHGWGRRGPSQEGRARNLAAMRAARQAKGQIFNEAQSAFLRERYNAGLWPTNVHAGAEAAVNRRLRAEIVAGVAERGPAATWATIGRHPRWTSPGYRRWDEKRKAAGRAAKELSR